MSCSKLSATIAFSAATPHPAGSNHPGALTHDTTNFSRPRKKTSDDEEGENSSICGYNILKKRRYIQVRLDEMQLSAYIVCQGCSN